LRAPKYHNPVWLSIIIVLAAIACYGGTIHTPFLWDHEVTILGNPLIRSWQNFPAVFRSDVYGKPLTNVGYYRPLEVTTFMLDYSFWGLNPVGFHIATILLHIGNALLLFHVLKKIGLKIPICFFAGLIFAIHPVNSTSVTYLIRSDMMGLFFSLLCILFFLSARSHLFAGLSILAYILALFSKESMAMVPFIILAYALLFPDKEARRPKYLLMALLAISGAYIFIKLRYVFAFNYGALSLIAKAPFWQRILTLPRLLLTYIRLLIFPTHLHMEYHFVEKIPPGAYVWLGLPVLVFLGVLFVRYIRAMPAADSVLKRQLCFFSFWFLAGLAPFYNIIVTLHSTVAENWLYFSGVGFIVSAVILGVRFFERTQKKAVRKIITLAVVLLLGYYCVYTIKRSGDWADAMGLYQHDLKYEPNSFVLHNNVGVIHFRNGNFPEAKQAFLRAIEVSPDKKYEVAYNNVGVIYENEGNLPAAEEAYKTSIRLNRYELAYGNLKRVYLKQGRTKDAEAVEALWKEKSR
jgi:tetratricopeptide (TPR) repeat protein